MKIISEEQEDADEFANTNNLHLNVVVVGAVTAGNCHPSAGEGRNAAVKAANEPRYRNGDVATDDSIVEVNGCGGSPHPVTVRKKKKRASLDGSCSSEKHRFLDNCTRHRFWRPT